MKKIIGIWKAIQLYFRFVNNVESCFLYSRNFSNTYIQQEMLQKLNIEIRVFFNELTRLYSEDYLSAEAWMFFQKEGGEIVQEIRHISLH